MQPTLTPKRSDLFSDTDRSECRFDQTTTLKELAGRGLYAGPDESLETFIKRCSKVPKSHELDCNPYDISVDWVPLSYSNKKLLPWEAGATWIGKQVSIQLRKIFRTKNALMGNQKDEVIAHEVVHAIRCQFDEPRFEEVLAFRCSKKWWRRYFSPLVQTKMDLLIFALSALFLPFGFVGFAYLLGKLIRKQAQVDQVLRHLEKMFTRPKRVLFLLTDREIMSFARSTRDKIENYIAKQSSVRWKQIQLTEQRLKTNLRT